ncbi:MAG: FtsX-like permease family protein [Pseudomonadota bacterium]|nr:FtsX-like permease family protein [Pseudomonadota bacterium]
MDSAVGVFGLAVGLWAALTTALVLRNQLSFDDIVAGREQVFLAASASSAAGRPVALGTESHSRLGKHLLEQFPEIRNQARLQRQNVRLERQGQQTRTSLYWADPDTFVVLPLPVQAGDPVAALRLPDSLVMTRAQVRRHFGSNQSLGQTLLVNGHPMVLRAVIADLPSEQTQFDAGIYASALAAFSPLAQQDADPKNAIGSDFVMHSARTYLRVAPGTDVEDLQQRVGNYWSSLQTDERYQWVLELVRLDRVHTDPRLNPGIREKLVMVVALGAVILLIAMINFANLLVARSARRAVEVGVRRVSGATRSAIARQFLIESAGSIAIALLLAVALLEWSLPYVNAFLDTGASLDYRNAPGFLACALLAALAAGMLAALGPVLVIAAFPLLDALSGRVRHSRAGTRLRNLLVTVQFGLLVGLLVCTGIIYLQRSFATSEALRVETDQMMAILTPCQPALTDGLRALPGVRGVSCTGLEFLVRMSSVYGDFRGADGTMHDLNVVPMDGASLALYGIQVLAGHGEFGTGDPDGGILVNEAAVRELGYASLQDAIGQPGGPTIGTRGKSYPTREIIGVVPDFSLAPVTRPVPRTAYVHAPAEYHAVHVKLSGRDVPGTLAAIDGVWRNTGGRGTPERFFIDDDVQRRYLSMMRQAQAFGFFSLLAASLGCLGLLALAASVIARRTREIGIRKALGAHTRDVLGLLLWQFSKPVVWAGLIACPAAAWVMQRWLSGFAYRIDLPLWLFPVTAGAALLVALLVVSAHSLRVAREKPVAALRHE